MPQLHKILDEFISVVADYTGIARDKILSKNRESDVVDARHITVMLLRKTGLYPSSIARIFNTSPRAIQYAINGFENRLAFRPFMRNCYENIVKDLRNNAFVTKYKLHTFVASDNSVRHN